jgi:2-keto-4-pentenoate hydratase
VGVTDATTVAKEFLDARCERRATPTPTSRDPGFTLDYAYRVEAAIGRARAEAGHRSVGWKVGYANRAMWRALKLDTLAWARMYDDTVQYAKAGDASLSISAMLSAKIEPEVVFKLKQPVNSTDAATALESVEWIAIGYEIIDCPFEDWTFTPADWVAAFGLHAALIVGTPLRVEREHIPALVEALPKLTVRLLKGNELIEEGSGKNSLKSPALCVGELAAAMSRRAGETLQAGDLISTGTLTTSQPIAAGETWTVAVEGLDLAPLTLHTRP